MRKILVSGTIAAMLMWSCQKNQSADPLQESAPLVAPQETLNIEETREKLSQVAQTNLALSEPDFDFGTIKKGEVVQHIYEITNTGKNPLIISNVQPTCGCTVPDFTKTPILPGKKGQITLTFDSSNFDGVVHKTAEVYANVAKVPIELRFTADIQP